VTIIAEPSGLLLERRYLFIYDIKNKDQSIGGKARLGLCLWGACWVLFSVIRPSLKDLNLNMMLFFKNHHSHRRHRTLVVDITSTLQCLHSHYSQWPGRDSTA
jgi:hypothetical protein